MSSVAEGFTLPYEWDPKQYLAGVNVREAERIFLVNYTQSKHVLKTRAQSSRF